MNKALQTLRRLTDSVLPLFFWVFLIFGFDTPDIAILTIAAAIIHELGHISALIFLTRDMSMRSHLSGFRIRVCSRGYREQVLILAAGPIANITIFLLLFPFSSGGGYAAAVGLINLLSAISNLLPIEGYDGYGILHSLASSKNSDLGLRALYTCSFILSFLFTVASLYLILRYGSGYWIFAVFFIALLGKIKKLFHRDLADN